MDRNLHKLLLRTGIVLVCGTIGYLVDGRDGIGWGVVCSLVIIFAHFCMLD